MYKMFLDGIKRKRIQIIDEGFGLDPLKLKGAELKKYHNMHRCFDFALVVFFAAGVAALYFFVWPWLQNFFNR